MNKLNKIIFGNWKMNMTYNETFLFCKEFNHLIKKDNNLKSSEILYGVAPTFLGILPTKDLIHKSTIVGAQNASNLDSGAFTSQISYSQLKEFDITHIIIGHSEVRQFLKETDEIINQKILKLLEQDMVPILCIGESLSEFENKKTIQVLKQQITADLKNVSEEKASSIIVAYEPIWAIGTGKTPTIEDIKNTCNEIRNILKTIFKQKWNDIHILYGGSLKPENAKEILALENVNGGLIGGASMKADSFYKIITSCPEYKK